MKTCPRCLITKPFSEFNRSKTRKNGCCTYCKSCSAKNFKRYYESKKEQLRAKRREYYYKNIEKEKKQRKEYYQTKNGKKHNRLNSANQREKYPLKIKAINALNYAVIKGYVSRQPCETCGSENRVHGHHEDYTKPLDVVWLCCDCHHKKHRKLRNSEYRTPTTI